MLPTPESKDIPLGLIDEPALPSRTEMDEQKMAELVADIRAIGIHTPLILARKGDRFEVIAGHRRWHAARVLGLAVVPARVYPSKASIPAWRIQHGENAKREKVNPADEAIWFAEQLETECGGDVDTLCAQIGEKREYVETRLALLAGDELVLQRLREKRISLGVAVQLNHCPDERMRRYFLDAALNGGATVAVVNGWITDWKREQDRQGGVPYQLSDAPAPAPMPQADYFVCVCCRGRENVGSMRPINVHDYCYHAILSKLLAAYHGDEQHETAQTDPRRT